MNNNEYKFRGPSYKLPDPADYLGSDFYIEVYISEAACGEIYDAYNDNYSDGYFGKWFPYFEIDTNVENHKLIKWGIDACKYCTGDMRHIPKYYKLGNQFGGKFSQRTIFDADVVNAYYHITDISAAEWEDSRDGISESGYLSNIGLYLVPSPMIWKKIEHIADQSYTGIKYCKLRMHA